MSGRSTVGRAAGMSAAVMSAAAMVPSATAVVATTMSSAVSPLGLGQARRQSQDREEQR